MTPRVVLGLALAIAVSSAAVAVPAAAAPDGGPDRARAAAAFDQGVAHYKRAEYTEAARAFDEADRLAPSVIAVTNGMSAAKRAGDHLLAAHLAERAIARGDALVESRDALADASTHLCRFEITCAASPCTLSLDGTGVTAGTTYALAGNHSIEARGSGTVGEERILCAAGSTYRLVMQPTTSRPDARVTAGPPPLPVDGRPPPPQTTPTRGLHPAVFFVGVGLTVVLASVTVWSGMDAISAKNGLPPAPTQTEEDDVRSRARRTDFLLLGAGLAGIGTAVLGAVGTSWHKDTPPPVGLLLAPSTAGLTYAGRFR